jgi:hypothetical protein
MPLVHVGAGVAVHVVVEPEERLLLALVTTGRVAEVHLVDPLAGLEGGLVGEPPEGTEAMVAVMGVAVGLRGGVPVVQVREERVVGRSEVLAPEAVVLVQVVLEAHERAAPVLGVDPRPGEGPVEAVDRAVRQVPRVGVAAARRGDVPAEAVDRLHRRRGEAVAGHLELDLIDERDGARPRVGRRHAVAWPQLMGPERLVVPALVVVVRARGKGVGPLACGDAALGVPAGRIDRPQRLGDVQRVVERPGDQRAGRERLDEDGSAPLGESRGDGKSRGGEREHACAARAQPQHVAARQPNPVVRGHSSISVRSARCRPRAHGDSAAKDRRPAPV